MVLPTMDKTPPLFLPLKAEYFRAFVEGRKSIEWRKLGKRYNERTLFVGRKVTLSNGYSGARLYGSIVRLEFSVAEKVGPDALALFTPRQMLAGIHVKLISLKPQLPQRS
jgi:hypothetical protein